MLPPFRLRSIALALLQLLPERQRPGAHRLLIRLRHLLFPMTRRQMAQIRASGLWDAQWFARQHPEVIAAGVPDDGLLAFVRQGRQQALCPHPLFDSAWYLEQNPDVAAQGLNPLCHYLSAGHREGRQPNVLFSDHWYRENNPDVAEFQGPALQHYVLFGDAEGRNPHPLLQTGWYRSQAGAGPADGRVSVLADYLQRGEAAGLRPNPWFDPGFYMAQVRSKWPQVAAPRSALADFVSRGAREGLDPSAEFSLAEYCEAHPEVAERGDNPLIHFLASGRATSRRESLPPLQAQEWLSLFGYLGAQEHALLAAHVPGHGRGRVVVLHPPGQAPDIKRSAFGALEISLHETLPDSLQAVDAVVRVDRPLQLHEDALQLGLSGFALGLKQPLYFDELIAAPEGPARLNFKPDWSPARHRAGALDIPLLMLPPDCYQHAGDPALTGRTLTTLPPRHLPLVAARISEARRIVIEEVDPAPPQALVSILIPTRDQLDYLRKAVEGIQQRTDYPAWEIVIIDNGSEQADTRAWLREVVADPRIRVKPWPRPFNYSELCNVGAREARGELLCLLNNDVEIKQPDWLDRLARAALEPDCGAVGALLLYPDGRIQSGGVLMGPGGVAANRFATVHPDQVPGDTLDHLHEVSAVAGACLLTRRSVYEQLGGLNEEQLGVAFNDVDYCLRLREQGLYCRLEPRARLVHHESVSLKDHARGRAAAFADEVRWMQQRWAAPIARDPFHNLNLRLSKFQPLTVFPGNRRALLWPEFGIRAPEQPGAASLHPPLRWYVDSSQDRVGAVREARRALSLASEASIDGLAILILTKDRPEYIIPLVQQLATAVPAFAERQLALRILIGDTGSSERKVLDFYRRLPQGCELVSGLQYQFSRCNNQLLERAADYRSILFLNNDIRFADAPASLLRLYTRLHAEPDTGVVGAVLRFADGSVQHEGIAAFPDGPLRAFVHHPGARGPVSLGEGEERRCLAVTGALLMARAEALRVTGGFDEAYAAECQDVDLCLAAARGGYASILLNAGEIIHFENGTRPAGEEVWADRRRLMRRWHNWIEEHWL